MLTESQIASYWDTGYLVLENAVLPEQLAAMQADFDAWVEQSRVQPGPFGTTLDGRARFDVEPGHRASSPALRRVAAPVDISEHYLDVMRTAPAVDAVADLIGPNVEYNNSKINSKQPGSATQVKFHQDFLFQPHSNEDLVAVLYFLDDVDDENGPLTVVPGSHRGPILDHWHDGVFTGAVDAETAEAAQRDAISCTGTAGTACLMHTRLLHGSDANRTDSPRTLFIAEYRAEDAVALQVNHLPSRFEGEVVRGEATGRVRTTAYEMMMPEVPEGASFFDQQAKGRS